MLRVVWYRAGTFPLCDRGRACRGHVVAVTAAPWRHTRRACGRGGVAVRVRGGHVVASWLCLWCRTGCRAMLCRGVIMRRYA